MTCHGHTSARVSQKHVILKRGISRKPVLYLNDLHERPERGFWNNAKTGCSGFCSDPTNSRAHPDTARHKPFGRLNRVFSVEGLKRGCLLDMDFLLCKQGVAGSIPVTSTRFLRTCGSRSGFCDAACDVTAGCGFVSRASSAFRLAASGTL